MMPEKSHSGSRVFLHECVESFDWGFPTISTVQYGSETSAPGMKSPSGRLRAATMLMYKMPGSGANVSCLTTSGGGACGISILTVSWWYMEGGSSATQSTFSTAFEIAGKAMVSLWLSWPDIFVRYTSFGTCHCEAPVARLKKNTRPSSCCCRVQTSSLTPNVSGPVLGPTAWESVEGIVGRRRPERGPRRPGRLRPPGGGPPGAKMA
mmetsp:Transcript_53883/g.151849  ORF Transcript_53883/g.151849 Transcript_53883/m.151849 type:complete len:208 (-) Transcript_53883:5-628(-)